MSKDRYSSDHTIEIVDDGTLTVDGDLIVTGTLDVAGSLEVSSLTVNNDIIVNSDVFVLDDVVVGDDLVVVDDASVGGTLTVTGSATAASFPYPSTKFSTRWVPMSVLANAIDAGSINGTDTAIVANGSSTILDYASVLIGHSTNPTWDIYIPVDPFIPNNTSIKEVLFFVENENAVGTADYEVEVETFNAAGSAGATVIGSGNASLLGVTGLRMILRFIVNTSVIEQDLFTPSCVRVKFAQVDGSEASVISIIKMGLVINIESVEDGFGGVIDI